MVKKRRRYALSVGGMSSAVERIFTGRAKKIKKVRHRPRFKRVR